MRLKKVKSNYEDAFSPSAAQPGYNTSQSMRKNCFQTLKNEVKSFGTMQKSCSAASLV